MRFNKRYRVYLQVDEQTGYQEIISCHISPFTRNRTDDNYSWRYAWGEVTFTNNPVTSSDLSDDKYLAYNLLRGSTSLVDYFTTIKIKYVDESRTIYGYFSFKDCKFKTEGIFKTIKVTPAILDTATALYENMEKEVDIIGGSTYTKVSWSLDADNATKINDHYIPVKFESSNRQELISGTNLPTDGYLIQNADDVYLLSLEFNANMEIATPPGDSSYLTITLKRYNSVGVPYPSNVMYNNVFSSEIVKIVISDTKSFSLNKGDSLRIEVSATGGVFVYKNPLNLRITGYRSNISTHNSVVNYNESNIAYLNRWDIGNAGRKYIKDFPALSEYFEDINSPNPGAPKPTVFGSIDRGAQDIKDNTYLYQSQDQATGLVEVYESNPYYYQLKSVTVWRGDAVRIGLSKRSPVHCTCTFAREEIITKDDINGDSVRPDGDGWHDVTDLQTTINVPDGSTLWVRKPYNGAYTDWNLGTLEYLGEGVYQSNGYFKWNSRLTSERAYPTTNTLVNYGTTIDLYDLIKYVFTNTAKEYNLSDVKSTFFWNDNQSLMPNLVNTTNVNYVTMANNHLNNLYVIPMLSFKPELDPNSEDSKLSVSFKKLMEELRSYFTIVGQGMLYWWVDDNSDLRIEHFKFLEQSTGVYNRKNLLTSQFTDILAETYEYSYDSSDMFAQITINNEDSAYTGFKKNVVKFDKIVSNSRNKDLQREISNTLFSTDIQYAKESPGELGDGFILICTDADKNVLRGSSDRATANGTEYPNGIISTANIINDFLRYSCVWYKGTVNGNATNFVNSLRNKMGIEFTLQGLYSYEFFSTALGIGMVETLTLDVENEVTKVQLSYNTTKDENEDIELKSGEVDGFYLMVQKEADFIGASDIYLDLGNYEN